MVNKKPNLGQKLEARPYHLHHSAFINQGQMIALELCFPGASAPLDPDDSYLSCLAPGPHRAVYAGSSGRAAHVVVSMLHSVTGFVFDLGAIKGAKECVALLSGENKLYACLNGSRNGFIVEHDYLALPPDCFQEWWFRRTPYKRLTSTEGKISGAVIAPCGIVGTDEAGPFLINKTLKLKRLKGEGLSSPLRLLVNADGAVYGLDRQALWRLSAPGILKKQAILPRGCWDKDLARFTTSPDGKRLFLADDEGRLSGFNLVKRKFSRLGRTPLTPVSCLAAVADGRLFGFCGNEIQHLFCWQQKKGVHDLGIAVSVIGRRRYGYQFADALTGPDGRIYFAERDRGGHLWVYFPAVVGR